ncbi:hypothetical protein EHI46_15515 [Rhizobium leguminosarum]|uniref:hypothetical protein n=1 Tax=Rhizobium leguminosarum TaxID=384 RepID=UPI000FED616B|nr:hypothetical protein [Rhizobium leguminosarum]RWY72345.1 hypothetical protein EHI46_15515 [Rhizobium leguminosarum]
MTFKHCQSPVHTGDQCHAEPNEWVCNKTCNNSSKFIFRSPARFAEIDHDQKTQPAYTSLTRIYAMINHGANPVNILRQNLVVRHREWGMQLMRIWLGLFFLPMLTTIAGAAECDRSMLPILSPADLAYQDRGDRCEGLYQQTVATTGLRILGFQRGASQISENDPGTYVYAEAKGRKQLVVESARRRQYYRMDATFDGNRFYYPLALTRRPELAIKSAELAARVCVRDCDGLLPVLVPARLAMTDAEAGEPFLLLQATEDLTYLQIEVTGHGKEIAKRDLLGSMTWASWRPIEIPLGEFLQTGKDSELTFKATARGRSISQLDSVSAVLRVEGE